MPPEQAPRGLRAKEAANQGRRKRGRQYNTRQFAPVSPREGKATFTVAGLKAGTKIEVVDESRTITAEDGKFSDTFGPLVEHVYRIGK